MDKKDNNLDDLIIEEEIDNSAESIKKLREKLKSCEAEKSEYLTGWQRAKADFVNARREMEEEKKQTIKFSERMLVSDFFELADSFDMFFMDKLLWNSVDKNWRQGIENLHSQMMKVFKSRGVEPIETIGKKFNPGEHEPLGEIEVDSEDKDGTVVDEMRKGYKMKDIVLRPALVKIGKTKNK